MKHLSRRQFIGGTMVAAAMPSLAARASNKAKVVVVGGGFAGLAAIRYIRHALPDIELTLIEPKKTYVTCPFSNYVIGGFKTLNSITWHYDILRDENITLIRQSATHFDADNKTLTLEDESELSWDYLVIATGIDFDWNGIEGYTQKESLVAPHAWKAGEQTLLLANQVKEMKSGGTIILTAPENPYRCPPAPYERASVIAWRLANINPRAKIIILDSKNSFTKQKLFEEGWTKLYKDRITWISAKEGGKVVRFDAPNMTLHTQSGQSFKADVANIVPPHHAGNLAIQNDLADETGWCPVDAYSMESTQAKNVYVIGDSIDPGMMPKSGFAANSQGKACAKHIVSLIADTPLREPIFMNTCYSLLAPDYGISVAGVYRAAPRGVTAISGAGGDSPLAQSDDFRKKEALYADGWYHSITSEMFL